MAPHTECLGVLRRHQCYICCRKLCALACASCATSCHLTNLAIHCLIFIESVLQCPTQAQLSSLSLTSAQQFRAHLISSHLVSSHLISSHLSSAHLISVALCLVTSNGMHVTGGDHSHLITAALSNCLLPSLLYIMSAITSCMALHSFAWTICSDPQPPSCSCCRRSAVAAVRPVGPQE